MAQDTYVVPSIQASGAALADLTGGGLKGLLEKLIAANPAVSNPSTQATVAPTGGGTTGGSLPAGVYYCSYTFVAPGGETAVGTSESASFTVSSGNKPRVTFPALPTGVRSINLYLTAAGGAAGSETLHATGITTTTFDLLFAGNSDPANVKPPATNTTGLATLGEKLRGMLGFQADRTFQKLTEHVTSFAQGDGVPLNDVKKMVRDYSDVFSAWAKVMNDFGGLVVANPGTLADSRNAVTGAVKKKRTFS